MQRSSTQSCRVGVWRNSPLKCDYIKRRTTFSDCPSIHFSSAGLSLVAHLPQQTTSVSTQQQQCSMSITIFTTCLNSQPLTPWVAIFNSRSLDSRFWIVWQRQAAPAWAGFGGSPWSPSCNAGPAKDCALLACGSPVVWVDVAPTGSGMGGSLYSGILTLLSNSCYFLKIT
jgi:hypothetical protein